MLMTLLSARILIIYIILKIIYTFKKRTRHVPTAKKFWNKICFKSSIKRVFTIILIIAFIQLCQFPYMNLNNIQEWKKYTNVVSTEKVFQKPAELNSFSQTAAIGVMTTGEALLGFTLVEMLITLAIVGVIAALTISSLIQNIQYNQDKTAYQKAFSVASQAWMTALNDGKIIPRTGWADDTSNNANWATFESYFQVAQDCTNNNNAQCWSSNAGDEKYGGNPQANTYAFIDNSGMTWSRSCNTGCGFEIILDTNGLKGPNKFGKDRFLFQPLNADGTNTAGLPVRIAPYPDYTSVDGHCPSGGCYYTSWLTGAK